MEYDSKVKYNKGNRTNKGEITRTKKLCIGVTFVCLELVLTN